MRTTIGRPRWPVDVHHRPGFFVFACVMAIIMLIKHRANIVRLIHGEEPIMGIFEKKDKTETDEGGQEDE